MNLVELFDNIVQMQALNGVPLANGKLYVYALGRTRLMDTWSDVDGESLNTNPIILDDAGQAHCFVSDDFDYTLVVCDAYDNEVFSIDKYLYSKGEHSHADVAVAPSEHIGVSSYHVGETTVYVPYIQGELGKTYHGIEPIVVNNQENKISARNIPLGVQEPLYFVEDSESACIIGASGLQPSGNYATVDWVIEHDYMQKEKLEFNESGQVTGFDGSAFAAGSVDPSEFIPWSASSTFQSAGNYATTDDLTAYYPNSNPNGFINSDAISAMATTGFVADVSADITAMIPSTAGLATENWVTSQGYLTEHQSLDGLMSASLLESSGGLITGYNGTAFAGQGGGGITGEYELSAGNGISINNDPIEQKTVISVSADYATNSDLQNVSGDITALIPSTAGLATTGDVADLAESISETYQVKGDYLTADALDNISGNWNEVSAKLDTTAFSDVSGTFITAHQDLSNYATTASVAEKLDTTAFSDVSGTFLTAHQDISNKLDTTAFSDVSGSFLTAVPDTYLQNTDLSTEDGKVTAISGIPLSAGGDVPEGVMVESGLEYNAVGEISGYGNSAIAQYGAEKQWLQHDDTIVHVSNSAQYAFGVNLSAVAQLLGVDETVLFDGQVTVNIGNTAQLSESIHNFEYIKMIDNSLDAGNTRRLTIVPVVSGTLSIGTNDTWTDVTYNPTIAASKYAGFNFYMIDSSGITITTNGSYIRHMGNTGAPVARNQGHLYKIIGVHRISG